MTSEVENVLVAALRLPAESRAVLAAELIESLDESCADSAVEVQAAWAEEIEQRLADADAGVVTPISWSEAKRRICGAASGRENR